MLRQAAETVTTLFVATGAIGLAGFAAHNALATVRYAFQPSHTMGRDGTVSDDVDSFRLRSWVLGLLVPSYRRTAVAGLGGLALATAVTVLAALVAFLLAFGLVG